MSDAALSGLKVVPVALGERAYDVVVGAGARRVLPGLVPPGAQLAAVVSQAGVAVDVDPGIDTVRTEVPPGESAKSMAAVEDLCRFFAGAGVGRADVVVAVGGGVVTDVVGFAAATYLRGVAYVNVATTLLAMVDAAIGGKTGVNLPEGKNLAGAFWQPAGVLCDTDTLASLPAREWASGRGEMAKYAFIDPSLAPSPAAVNDFLALGLDDQVARCAAIKAAVVSADEREGGARALLNYGHTLAHALEGAALDGAPVDLRHGEAVAIGLVFAAELARRLGRVDAGRVALHRTVVDAFDLPGEVPQGLSASALLAFMARDKKARHDLSFVLDGPAGLEVVRQVPPEAVVATLTELGCGP